jgi:hypothetical protein
MPIAKVKIYLFSFEIVVCQQFLNKFCVGGQKKDFEKKCLFLLYSPPLENLFTIFSSAPLEIWGNHGF